MPKKSRHVWLCRAGIGGPDGPDRRAAAPADEIANAVKNGEVVDLTVTVADNYPAHWPFHRRSSAGP